VPDTGGASVTATPTGGGGGDGETQVRNLCSFSPQFLVKDDDLSRQARDKPQTQEGKLKERGTRSTHTTAGSIVVHLGSLAGPAASYDAGDA